MKPYYQDEHVTLYHGDCLKHPELWTTADVLITDPPYGINWQGGPKRLSQFTQHINGDECLTLRDSVIELWGNKPGIVFGVWQRPRPKNTKGRIIWAKNQMTAGNLNHPWGPADEEIYLTGEWPKRKPGGRKRHGGSPNRFPGVLSYPVVPYGHGHHRDHPTPKPVSLMEELVRHSPPGVIADPFAGSGSTLIAARNLGRKSIGFEIEEKYCELIAKRLSQQAFQFH